MTAEFEWLAAADERPLSAYIVKVLRGARGECEGTQAVSGGDEKQSSQWSFCRWVALIGISLSGIVFELGSGRPSEAPLMGWAVVLFVVAGVTGLLWFGFKQLFREHPA